MSGGAGGGGGGERDLLEGYDGKKYICGRKMQVRENLLGSIWYAGRYTEQRYTYVIIILKVKCYKEYFGNNTSSGRNILAITNWTGYTVPLEMS